MWIFGYGSLIWKPGFEWVDKRTGFVRGWKRRFYQGSSDHRGVPGAPGRVVTLLPDPPAVTWGVAYRVEGQEADRITEQLDHREQGGYERHRVSVFDRTSPTETVKVVENALIYVATEENPHYLGSASAMEIARQVQHSRGPSGPNTEYVLRLAESLRSLDMEDRHVFCVAQALRRLLDD